MDRDRTKQLVEHTNKINRQKKELELSKNLRQEVEIGHLLMLQKTLDYKENLVVLVSYKDFRHR